MLRLSSPGTPGCAFRFGYKDHSHIDILLRVNAEESHGTAPLDWDIRVCSLPLVPAVGIRWTTHIG